MMKTLSSLIIINYINVCVLKDISQIIVPFVTGTYDTTDIQ